MARKTPKKRRGPQRKEWKSTFLEHLRVTGNVSFSAQMAGISRFAVYRNRDKNDKFKAAWDDAVDEAMDVLELEGRRRAFEGCPKPVVTKGGDLVMVLRDRSGNIMPPPPPNVEIPKGWTLQPLILNEYSDTLLIFLLKGGRPQKFRENIKHQVVGDKDEPLRLIVDTGLVKMPEQEQT